MNLIGRMKPGQSHEITEYDMREAAQGETLTAFVAGLSAVRAAKLTPSGNWRITKS
jgi:hypothetical protein